MDARAFVTHPIPESGLSVLEAAGVDCEVSGRRRPLSADELIEGLRDREGLLCLLIDRVDAHVIESCPRLRGIANCAAGFDNIDVGAAKRRGIPVSNVPGVLTETTADLAWALILAVARRVVEADRFTRAGGFRGWEMDLLPGTDVHGKTLGIIGAGRIGAAVAERSVGFRMRLIYCSRRRNERIEKDLGGERVDLEPLLRHSDFVSLHVPLTPQTHHLIGERELGLMKRGAVLVNTSRGAVVDEKALVRALRERRIAGAGLDVYEDEPRLAAGLAELPNTVLLPHIGSASRETRALMAERAARNLVAMLRGERPPDLVSDS